jgi:hypothetical protein
MANERADDADTDTDANADADENAYGAGRVKESVVP